MSSLIPWEPFREVISLRDAMNRLFDESWLRPWWRTGEGGMGAFVPVDMYEKDDRIIVEASLPGMNPKDIDIRVTGNTLTIKGEFRDEDEGKRGRVHFRERRYGAFQRTLALPVDVDSDKAEATFENGILRLELPKTEEAKAKQIAIKTK